MLVSATVLISVNSVAAVQDQTPAAQEKPKKHEDQFFSGNVVALSGDQITVSRRTLTLTTITRSFNLDPSTVVEGKLQLRARVTVKFEKADAGDYALRIIVR